MTKDWLTVTVQRFIRHSCRYSILGFNLNPAVGQGGNHQNGEGQVMQKILMDHNAKLKNEWSIARFGFDKA
ncbi:MAG: hypothetical protein L0H75_05090 [Nitrosospira sp.]|nr:hypothetical protein [Nitrosospira sp.]